VSSALADPTRAKFLGIVTFELQRRFERTGLMNDLNIAITVNEQAVVSTPEDHPNRGVRLNNLGSVLQS
jgi:hypothetical protein